MGFAEYADYDGLGLAELVRKKKVKPAELVEAAIERIERHNRQLNAVVFKAYGEARTKAKAKHSGAFIGVPMLLKDILGFKKGWPTRSGSRFMPASPPDRTQLEIMTDALHSPKGICRDSASAVILPVAGLRRGSHRKSCFRHRRLW